VIERRAHSLVHHLFEYQANETPDKVAVSCGDRTLTYAELDLAAETLASSLRARGACAEKLIGLYVDRSVSMVVALLAILESGHATIGSILTNGR
jgi:non-ribosomal peptide synthetase component F